MALIFPGQPLIRKMDSQAVERLGHLLKERITDLEREHAPLFRAMTVWWKWYEATPRDKEKNFPFKGASNVVVPLIGVTCDALAARSVAQATAASPTYWSCRTENEGREATARNMARYLNWQADGNSFSIKHVLNEAFLDMYVCGRAVVAANYRTDVRPFFYGRTPLNGQKRLAKTLLTVNKGPTLEHVAGEHMLWDRRQRIGDAPIVVRKREYQWTELRDMAKLDEAWDRDAVEDIKKFPGYYGDEGSTVERVKADLDLRDTDTLMIQPHDIREVWVDWSLLGNQFEVPGDEEWGGSQVPLMVHLHMLTGKVLRLVGTPYLLPYKPFIDFKFRSGRGAAKRLEQLQSMQTTLWNQSIDARTRANAVWAKTRNAKHLRTTLDPSHPVLVDSMDEFETFNLPTSVQQDLPLILAAQQMAERWMGHSDPLLGRETRSGGHPAPATSTLALLEQVNVMSAGTDTVIQEELSRAGEMLAILNQQFHDESDMVRLQQILGESDAAAVVPFLFPDEPVPGNYFFDVVALSRTENPDSQMRRALMVAQAYQNYGALAAQGAMVIDSPQASPRLKAVWVKLLDGYGSLMERFLDASNVDDGERFLVELNSIGLDARNAFRQFTAEAAAAAAAAPGGGGPGVGAGGQPIAGGAAGPGAGVGNGAGSPFGPSSVQ